MVHEYGPKSAREICTGGAEPKPFAIGQFPACQRATGPHDYVKC